MADRRIEGPGPGARLDPVAAIARADRLAREARPFQAPAPDEGPDLVSPSAALAPRGLAGLVDRALGTVSPPGLLELAGALEELQGHAALLADIDPALADVAAAVLCEEEAKVMRYVTLRDA